MPQSCVSNLSGFFSLSPCGSTSISANSMYPLHIFMERLMVKSIWSHHQATEMEKPFGNCWRVSTAWSRWDVSGMRDLRLIWRNWGTRNVIGTTLYLGSALGRRAIGQCAHFGLMTRQVLGRVNSWTVLQICFVRSMEYQARGSSVGLWDWR